MVHFFQFSRHQKQQHHYCSICHQYASLRKHKHFKEVQYRQQQLQQQQQQQLTSSSLVFPVGIHPALPLPAESSSLSSACHISSPSSHPVSIGGYTPAWVPVMLRTELVNFLQSTDAFVELNRSSDAFPEANRLIDFLGVIRKNSGMDDNERSLDRRLHH